LNFIELDIVEVKLVDAFLTESVLPVPRAVHLGLLELLFLQLVAQLCIVQVGAQLVTQKQFLEELVLQQAVELLHEVQRAVDGPTLCVRLRAHPFQQTADFLPLLEVPEVLVHGLLILTAAQGKRDAIEYEQLGLKYGVEVVVLRVFLVLGLQREFLKLRLRLVQQEKQFLHGAEVRVLDGKVVPFDAVHKVSEQEGLKLRGQHFLNS